MREFCDKADTTGYSICLKYADCGIEDIKSCRFVHVKTCIRNFFILVPDQIWNNVLKCSFCIVAHWIFRWVCSCGSPGSARIIISSTHPGPKFVLSRMLRIDKPRQTQHSHKTRCITLIFCPPQGYFIIYTAIRPVVSSLAYLCMPRQAAINVDYELCGWNDDNIKQQRQKYFSFQF